MSAPPPGGSGPRTRLDLTSRLTAKSLLSAPLTETAALRAGAPAAPRLSVTAARLSLTATRPPGASLSGTAGGASFGSGVASSAGTSVAGAGALASAPDASFRALDALNALTGPERFISRRRAIDKETGALLDDSVPLPPQERFLDSLGLSDADVARILSGGFIFLRRVRERSGHFVSPYALEVAPRSAVDPDDHFTLSTEGLTHFSKSSSAPSAGGSGAPAADQVSTFVSLAQISREFKLFNSITIIPFFSKFRVWKSWKGWRACLLSARLPRARTKKSRAITSPLPFPHHPHSSPAGGLIAGRKRKAASATLSSQLFILNDILRAALLELRKLTMGIANMPLFIIDRHSTVELATFVSAQSHARAEVATRVAAFGVAVRSIVRGAANDTLDAFLSEHKVSADGKMSFMERRELRETCARIATFIRVADLHVRDCLLSLALEGVESMAVAFAPGPGVMGPLTVRTAASEEAAKAATLAAGHHAHHGSHGSHRNAAVAAPVAKPFTPLLSIFVDFADAPVPRARAKLTAALEAGRSMEEEKKGEGADEAVVDALAAPADATPTLVFSPSLYTVRSTLRSTLTDAMAVIGGVPRMLTHADMAPYVQAAVDDAGVSVAAPAEEGDGEEGASASPAADGGLAVTALHHPTFKRSANRLLAGVDAAFAALAEFSISYVPYIKTYINNEAVLGSSASYSGGRSQEDLETAIALYKGQNAEFDHVALSADIGVLRADSVGLKGRLTPSPLRMLDSIRKLIPSILQELTTELVNEMRPMFNILSSTPTEVEPFVLKAATLEKSVEKIAEFRERSGAIRSLTALMVENAWSIADDLKALFRVLSDTLTDLESAASKTESSLEADSQKFIKKVEDAIPVLRKEVYAMQERLTDPCISAVDAPVAKTLKFLKDAAAQMGELKAQSVRYAQWQAQLKQNVTELEIVEEVFADMNVKLKLWEATSVFSSQKIAWQETPFSTIDEGEMSRAVQGFIKTAARSEKMLVGNAAAAKFKGEVEDFKGLLPVIGNLRNKTLQPRHWKDIEAALGVEIDPTKEYTLGELFGLGVLDHQSEIETISTKAVQESALLELFNKKVTSVWTSLDFTVNSYKESKEVFILGAVDEVIAALDESLVNINTILGSRYCAPIRGEVETYQKKLLMVSETLDEWLNCQKAWMYLESIFSADDIKRQLPEESKKFTNVDRSWRTIMKRTYGNPNVIVSGAVKGLKETFLRHNEVLDAIQKALENYLETKRGAFPRFYFLSNEELLEILAQTRDPQAVQPHLRKVRRRPLLVK